MVVALQGQAARAEGAHELSRHLQVDAKMSSFDLAVQFLDADGMTYWGKRRDANFWIENASIKWNEAQAPFHTVARLTLLPKSQLLPDAAEAIYFDVTGNSTPDSKPVGSVNRTRWPAEIASRTARMAQTAVPALDRRYGDQADRDR